MPLSFGFANKSIVSKGNKSSIVTDNLILHLDASNTNSYSGSGTTWTDLSGCGNHVTLTNGPTYSSSDGGYFTFDGVNDYLSSLSLANPNGQLTYEAVINYNNTGSYQNIIEVSPYNRPMLWIDNNGKFEASYPTGSGGVTSANAYNGQKITVTAVYDTNSSPGVKLYVNGVLIGSNSSAHVAWSNPSTFTLFNRATGSSPFNGKVYSVKIYNRALSASEIQTNYNASKYGSILNNASTYFDASRPDSYVGSGTTVTNLKNAAQTATLRNGATWTQDFGGMFVFDGSNDDLLANYNIGISGDAAFSISTWVRMNITHNDYAAVVYNDGVLTNNAGVILTMLGNRPALDFVNNRVRAASALQTNTWYHIVITKSPGSISSTTKIYINGVLVSSSLEGNNDTPNITNSTLVVGRLNASPGRYFNGNIAALSIHNSTLTENEVSILFNNSKTRFGL